MNSPAPLSPSLSGRSPRPLQLVDGNLQSPVASSCPSPTMSGLSTPPPSARKLNPRRQSSISYYPSDHTPSWDVRSPTTAGPSSLRRSASLNQKVPARLNLKSDRRSLPTSDVVVEAERPPLTLTEKHADLLRFIAQKESKCLELRSQLAVHETELAQLKRKWERIVSRGMDRAYAQQPMHPGAGSASLLTGAVKDVSRLLAAGLSDLSTSPCTTPAKQEPTVPPLRTPVLKAGRTYGHANTQSTSSVSTSATSTSMTKSSVRLSQSSASSLAFDEPPFEQDEAEGGDEGKSARDSESLAHRHPTLRVDGGTGIESPIEVSSALKMAKLHRRKSREVPAPPSPLATFSTPLPSTTMGNEKVMREEKKTISKRSSLQIRANGIPPAASIPGLGPLASPLASTWMGSVGNSVGKKWEELQKGDTFTKSQKRASLLFSDAANSFLAALTSPSTSTSTSTHTPTLAPPSAPISVQASPSTSAQSLLEDDDDASALGSVLVPDSKPLAPKPKLSPTPAPKLGLKTQPAPTLPPTATSQAQSKSLLDDDDEWNW